MLLHQNLYLANFITPLYLESYLYNFLFFIPIVIIEGVAHYRILRLKIFEGFLLSIATNLVSLSLGFFVIHLGDFLLKIDDVIKLVEQYNLGYLAQWGVYVPNVYFGIELMITFILSFIISFAVEMMAGFLIIKLYGVYSYKRSRIAKSFFIANLLSYLFLEIFVITQILKLFIN